MRVPRAWLVVAAFASVYVIWGSTYLAIRFSVETMPPFLMAAARWLVAGAVLFAWRIAVSKERPTLAQWRTAAIVGVLLILGGNGIVSFAEQQVPSGLTALLIAIVPVWIALLEWVAYTKTRPSLRAGFGIALGVVGVALLVGRSATTGAPLLGALLILVASFSWANGSLYSRRAARPKDLLLGASMQMLAGGLALGFVGLAAGEWTRIDLAGVSSRSWISWGFLVLFGSIVAYSAYVWLLQVVRAELVATYAFVNPIVAVALAALFGDEIFTWRTGLVAALIVAAVALVVTAPKPAPPPGPEAPSVPSPKPS